MFSCEFIKKVHTCNSRMNFKSGKLLFRALSTCCLLLLTTAVNADTFLSPTGKLSPFRRDRLPISDQAIGGLSNDLTTLTGASPYETAEHRRAVAKVLALALALNPKNIEAENTLNALIEGAKPENADKEKIDRDKSHIWNSLQWLTSPEAGQDGNILAALIGETVANFFPSDPQASSYNGKPEHVAWNGWVEELASFKKVPVVVQQPKVEEKKDEDLPKLVEPKPTEKRKYDPKAGIVMDNAKISTVLQMYDEKKSVWVHKVEPVEMRSNNHPKDDDGNDQWGFRVQVSGDSDDYWQMQEEISKPLRDQLSKYLGQLPERGRVSIRMDEDKSYPFRKNRSAITGPAFVLANAALTGVAVDGIVVGEIDQSGKLKLPAFFWRALMELAEGSGGRLIIPASAEPMFINLLALEKPEFFFKYEVLVASSLDEFTTLASKESDAKHQEIYSKFKIIKDTSAGKAMGTYLNNKIVRERLQEIVTQAPYHLSSKVLLTYGSVSRPRYLTREALAAEIWRKVDVIGEIAKYEDFYGINSNQLSKLNVLYEQMRDDLRDLEQYTDSRNSDILKEAKEAVASVRSFGREFEGRAEMWEKHDKIRIAHNAMKDENRKLLEKLSELTGDPRPK